jgi:hypothetical protein
VSPRLGAQISEDYAGLKPIVIAVIERLVHFRCGSIPRAEH